MKLYYLLWSALLCTVVALAAYFIASDDATVSIAPRASSPSLSTHQPPARSFLPHPEANPSVKNTIPELAAHLSSPRTATSAAAEPIFHTAMFSPSGVSTSLKAPHRTAGRKEVNARTSRLFSSTRFVNFSPVAPTYPTSSGEVSFELDPGVQVPAVLLDGEDLLPQSVSEAKKGIAREFEREVMNASSDSNSPTSNLVQTWAAAKSTANDRFRALFGEAAYNEKAMQAAREALPPEAR